MTPDALAALYGAAFPDTRGWSASEFENLLGQSGVTLCTDGQAFALFRVTVDEAELLTIATHPTARRQGLASALLTRAEESATRQGATQMFLEVAEDNAAARALYVAASYVTIGMRPGYYRREWKSPVTALILGKQLVAAQS
ncbi:GNAT family N-acetyltransferase [Yoonia sediminilitoris]|uniref:Ribosomal-protein-alanine N-acetyltransferase n=1 Tax=Yoonia sediminilitoris TaxID=1286148 RepID=A0A2T6KKA8_9RHOB|nr:GNAT family N-acetyltransferase [Yoonia sediminilitoris]PUB16362.1 ribosomal-protein-alanine N-acetyltransferase [Yoonia sediminilitoris]RCW96711.1 ribosomal-protein-alanine N-acetyltransferase [Yoonia sediminilitoris]